MEIYFIFLVLITTACGSSSEERFDWGNTEENYINAHPSLNPITNENENNTRIVGGQIAAPNAYPYQCGLAIVTNNGFSWCGGSIISEYYVLTAAHCAEQAVYIEVLLGAHNREAASEPGRINVFVFRSSIIIHPLWNMQNMINDIALLRMPTKIDFTDKIRPISLPSSASNNFEGYLATISGWGHMEGGSKVLSKYLRVAQSYVTSNTFCSYYFGHLVHTSVICLDGSQGRGTCHGDSGGPFVVTEHGRGPVLAGLTSYGHPTNCDARWPTAFTRVSSHLQWISAYTGIKIDQ